jgi:mono/diheme cytochrome c family protein
MSFRFLLTCTLLQCCLTALAAEVPEPVRALLKKNCAECHGGKKQKGDVRLDDANAITPQLWAQIYDQVAKREMPPDDEPQPTDAERQGLIQHALTIAKQSSAIATTGLRRLNKREYANTVRDLLGLRLGTFDPGEFVYKDETDGFDTEAQALVISNELLGEYLSAAGKSLRHAFFTDSQQQPKSRILNVNPAKMAGTNHRYLTRGPDYIIGRCGNPNTKRGDMLFDGSSERTLREPGRYKITVTARAVDREAYGLRLMPQEGPVLMGFGVKADDSESVSAVGKLLRTFELQDDQDQTFEFETWIDKDHFPFFSFLNGSVKPAAMMRGLVRRKKLKESEATKHYVGPGIRISCFRVEGPFFDEWPAASIKTTLGTREMPDLKSPGTRQGLVQSFAERAFRHPVTPLEIEPYLRYLDKQRAITKNERESLIQTFAAMMTSPEFLYRREGEGELGSLPLANRLSYLLWSSMPDAGLYTLANSGKLKEPAVLLAEARRCLKDPRSQSFSDSFADQWLSLGKLGSMPPDLRGEYRAYYDRRLEPAMLEESRRFFRHVLQENRSVRDFIDSDYTFLNASLAEHYGVPFERSKTDALKKEFQRVTLPPNSMRGGLLGQASILTLTANGVDTSPIIRGHWILKELLGTPPPPPPKEVPAIAPDVNGATTVREQLERHRTDESCASCHRLMDPLGFALESFDPIGGLRTRYSKAQAVSTEGVYKGKAFADVKELRKILASDLRPFARHLVVQMSQYAKGRKLVPADYPAVEALLDRAEANDFRLQEMLLMIITGELMRNR